jgi:hypothetical protein
MPYKGSKNSIAAEIISMLPPAKHFYDIFGGGGAMTHAAALSGKYQYIHYNELNPLICKGFKMAVNGEFKNERRWISREYFNAHKGDDPYVAICWSFGNNLRDYLYSKELEPIKKAVHYARIYNSYCLLHELGIAEPSRAEPSRAEPIERLIRLREIGDAPGDGVRLQAIEQRDRLLTLQELTGNNIIITCGDYRDLDFEGDAVIYADPPYRGTSQYGAEFGSDAFISWAEKQKPPVYVSEADYIDRWDIVWSKQKQELMCIGGHKKRTEILYKVVKNEGSI